MPETSLSFGAATDIGRVRECNEDRYWIDSGRGIFLVVDGVGGQAGGELAAETAVEGIREVMTQPDTASADERIRHAITFANNCIFARAQEHPEFHSMACVLTLAVVEEGRVTIGHVGDSRLYLIWKGAIRKLTSDHSPAGEDEDDGALTEEQAMAHPRRHEVYRDVGSQTRTADEKDFIEVRQCRFRSDAAILLCSDGLTDQITSLQVREIVEQYTGDAGLVARELVEAANRAGGNDNITAVLVAGSEFRGCTAGTRPRFAATRLRMPARLFTGRLAFLIYGLLLGMLLWAVLPAARG
jgi:serine/threonine protein phosphatase PrpC